MDCSPPGPFVHGESPVANARVGCHALLQGIFLTQGSNPGLLHCRQSLNHLSHQGSPRILQWVVHPFSGDLLNPGIKLGLLHCRQILYQLSYQGSLYICIPKSYSLLNGCAILLMVLKQKERDQDTNFTRMT